MTSSNLPQMPPLTKGRQKIEINRIDDQQRLLVSSSKIHACFFKKASEISTICGVEMALSNLLVQLEAAKRNDEEFKKVQKARQKMFLWDAPLENPRETEDGCARSEEEL
ncbi:hypothetical protein LXL04_012637 [Taraxacum kok-saghyz]